MNCTPDTVRKKTPNELLEDEEAEEPQVTPFGMEFLTKNELVTAVQVYANPLCTKVFCYIKYQATSIGTFY